jgi:hypothetical protein
MTNTSPLLQFIIKTPKGYTRSKKILALICNTFKTNGVASPMSKIYTAFFTRMKADVANTSAKAV